MEIGVSEAPKVVILEFQRRTCRLQRLHGILHLLFIHTKRGSVEPDELQAHQPATLIAWTVNAKRDFDEFLSSRFKLCYDRVVDAPRSSKRDPALVIG